MTPEARPVPRQRVRNNPPAPAPVTVAPRKRDRTSPPRQIEAVPVPDIPAYHASAERQPRRAGAVGAEWHEVAGTEFDLFATRATSPYSYGGVAVASPGGSEIRGFYYKHADKNRVAIYIVNKDKQMEFVRWMTGTSVEAMQAVSAAWLARRGLKRNGQ